MLANKSSLLNLFFFLLVGLNFPTFAQESNHSIAREWNEALLHSIRKDFARPTVHARNLWHTSFAMYDAWAAFTPAAQTYFLGNTVGDYTCPFNGITLSGNRREAQEEAISYAAFRILKHRFKNSPRLTPTYAYIDSLMLHLGYDTNFTSTDYSNGSAAALGNYIAEQVIAFGLTDSANEQNQYANQFYEPANPPLVMAASGNPDIVDPNRWQPLTLDVYIDQSGNIIPGGTAACLSPEWGEVVPFALNENDLTLHYRDGHEYKVYHDPGPPPMIDTINGGPMSDLYKKHFTMVVKWSSHLDTADGVIWDISPASIGNVPWYPSSVDSLFYFYDYENGGDNSLGHAINPVTGMPYQPQLVPRADYARVLAEFWADGPDSETPPGHWFTLLNYVTDHPQHENKWMGDGPLLDVLEWDVKTYFTLGGAMHDAAITCWGIKGWYDYIRPTSAFRYLADQGQCSDSTLPNYSINGLELQPGFIEVVDSLDPIAGSQLQNVGKIKVRTWMGPDFVLDPAVDQAGVDWILAENWWSFQRPSFVAPPFPGFMSGHSTYSRAAAEIMEMMTGDAYFPGGMGEFLAKQNEFLFFEEGPSQDVKLQWATYRDASDQCSLSRIWGGIHPGVDDMPGRFIGEEIAAETFPLSNSYWHDTIVHIINVTPSPNAINLSSIQQSNAFYLTVSFDQLMDLNEMPQITFPAEDPSSFLTPILAETQWIDSYTFQFAYEVINNEGALHNVDVFINGGLSLSGQVPENVLFMDLFDIDFVPVQVVSVSPSLTEITRANRGQVFNLEVEFSEEINKRVKPEIILSEGAEISLKRLSELDAWPTDRIFKASYAVDSTRNMLGPVNVTVQNAEDVAGNQGNDFLANSLFEINIDWPLGTDESPSPAKENLTIFPNPVKSGQSFSLTFPLPVTGEYCIKDAVGRLYQKVEFDETSNLQVESKNLPTGFYSMQVVTSSGSIVSGVIIVN